MTAVHNTFIHGINSIAYHASRVSGEKVKPFVFFCLVIIEHLHHHHSIEEAFLFPALEGKLGEGTLSKNVEQHGDFVPQMEEFEVYLKDVRSGKLAYDGKDLVARMQTFTDEMVEHMSDEIKTLDAGRMRTAFTEKQLKDIDAGLMKIALKSVNFYTTMPFTVICRNPETPWFPTFPAPLKWATR
ncbi:hypothetical protein BDQ12DRAFT_693997 [Crucibulum laeve]|uniref:Hemerythrin-like domain-containing protein n=1 Tax=Crucibulum laeve TaxID=68775 RepID=A0A5C3LEK3_9AGAR|nr:hypothetical protein BDQ12DRAFT_693997 [Crucibulum laeve]